MFRFRKGAKIKEGAEGERTALRAHLLHRVLKGCHGQKVASRIPAEQGILLARLLVPRNEELPLRGKNRRASVRERKIRELAGRGPRQEVESSLPWLPRRVLSWWWWSLLAALSPLGMSAAIPALLRQSRGSSPFALVVLSFTLPCPKSRAAFPSATPQIAAIPRSAPLFLCNENV